MTISTSGLPRVRAYIREDSSRHSAEGREVALPLDDIGTGLAQLEQKAPRIWHALQFRPAKLSAD